ncbi:unnamed protein product [Ceutorhynchus assimilis]|uniref:Cytochrome P450 n=1 Tax=Ceutorhynchus assimilis TaxID=467358 RepID=A0A9N9QC04_9CUCU|nr:unnamed protein product [Ceutorhynchus assimilis]
MIFLTSIILLLTAVIVSYIRWRQRYWERKGVPQFDPDLIFGDTKPLLTGSKSVQGYFQDVYEAGRKKSDKHVGIYNFWQPEYVPIDLNIIKRIVTTDFNYFDARGLYHSKFDKFSENMFTLDGAEWKDRRVKITPTFTSGKIKIMFETVLEKASELSKAIIREADANKAIAVKELMARYGTDTFASVGFGLECNTLRDADNIFRQIGRKALKPNLIGFFLELTFPANLLAACGHTLVPKDVEAYFTNIVSDTLKFRESNDVKRNDFLQLLLQQKKREAGNDGDVVVSDDKKNLTEQEIINEAFLFYLVGFETSAGTMTFALLELAQNPQMQDKLREEILANLDKHNGKFTYESLSEMEYLDRILKETLRKYPVLAVYPRACSKDYKIPGTDVVLKKGTKVHIPAIGIHRDPEYYPNPEEFDPERFTPENIAKRPDFAYLPFGEGPRQCIGMRFARVQTKIGIATSIKDYRITLDERTQLPLQFDHASIGFTLKKDIMLRFTKV